MIGKFYYQYKHLIPMFMQSGLVWGFLEDNFLLFIHFPSFVSAESDSLDLKYFVVEIANQKQGGLFYSYSGFD